MHLQRATVGIAFVVLVVVTTIGHSLVYSKPARPQDRNQNQPAPDPAAQAQEQKQVPAQRPEQKLTEHDASPIFNFKNPAPLTADLTKQPKQGRITGFDFARDPLNSAAPFTTFDEIMKQESAAKPQVMAAQRQLLEHRYNLTPKRDANVTMSRGK